MEFLKLGKILQDYYAVPDYQRDYEWTGTQISTLVDDIFQVMMDDSSANHFFGAIVTIPFEVESGTNKSIDLDEYDINIKNVKHIVDGQQRLTSISLFVRAFKEIVSSDASVSNQKKESFTRQLDNLLLGNEYKEDDIPAPRLILNGNTGKCYNKSILEISSINYNKNFKGAKRLLAAYKTISSEIKARLEDNKKNGVYKKNEDFYKDLKDAITNKIVFVEIECNESSNAFQVFDSLNGKGLDLTAADRIKNIFMSWSPKGKGAQKWSAFESAVGSDFLTSFFVAIYFYKLSKRVAKNKLPDEFKTYKDNATTDYSSFYNDLLTDGTMYGKLRKAKTEIESIDNILKDFQALKMDQVYVLLFAVAKYNKESSLKSKEYKQFAETLLRLIVRMQVCEKSTNRLDTVFTTCINLMHQKSVPITLITKKLEEEINLNVDDAQFQAAFEKFSPQDNNVSEFYLRHIEKYLRTKNKDRNPVDRGLTVEHIIPQSLDDFSKWYGKAQIPEEIKADFKDLVTENIGNKALLFGDDNSSANNNAYNHKLNVYKNGKANQDKGTPVETFQLIKDLVNKYPTKFNHDEVFSRAKELASYAVKIW